MGFFTNLIDGVKSAGAWTLNNAGNIAGAVNAVAKVGGVAAVSIGTNNDVDDETRKLQDFHQNFDKASKKLDTLARNLVPKVEDEPESGKKQIDLVDSVTGIFKNQATLTPDLLPTHTMYEDLSKFLGQMNVPTSIQSEETTVDVINSIGTSLFKLQSPEDPSAAGDLVHKHETSIDIGGEA